MPKLPIAPYHQQVELDLPIHSQKLTHKKTTWEWPTVGQAIAVLGTVATTVGGYLLGRVLGVWGSAAPGSSTEIQAEKDMLAGSGRTLLSVPNGTFQETITFELLSQTYWGVDAGGSLGYGDFQIFYPVINNHYFAYSIPYSDGTSFFAINVQNPVSPFDASSQLPSVGLPDSGSFLFLLGKNQTIYLAFRFPNVINEYYPASLGCSSSSPSVPVAGYMPNLSWFYGNDLLFAMGGGYYGDGSYALLNTTLPCQLEVILSSGFGSQAFVFDGTYFYVLFANSVSTYLNRGPSLAPLQIGISQASVNSCTPTNALKTNNYVISGCYYTTTPPNGGIRIVDVTNPTLPTPVFLSNVAQLMELIDVDSTHAYFQTSNNTVEVWNIQTIPPYLAGLVAIAGEYFGMAVQDGYLYTIAKNPNVASDTLRIYQMASNAPPTLVSPIANQYAPVGDSFLINIANTFQGAVEQPLALSATNLPNWLTFLSAETQFVGTPAVQNLGASNITVSACYANQLTNCATDMFTMQVVQGPILNQPVPDILVTQCLPKQVALSNTTFTDPTPLRYYATAFPSGSLPAWVAFDETNLSFNLQTPCIQAGALFPVSLLAINQYNLVTTDQFNIVVNNGGPVPVQLIPDQAAVPGKPWVYSFPVNVFENSLGLPMSYSASLFPGIPLPSSLTFVGATRTFSGVLSDGAYEIIISASTTNGLEGFTAFQVSFNNGGLTLSNPIPDQTFLAKNGGFQFTINQNTFTDFAGVTPSYSSSPLPGWLTFNAQNLRFTGTPSVSAAGSYQIPVNGTLGANSKVTFFKLNVASSPIVVSTVSSQQVGIGENYLFSLPESTFFDPLGYPMTYAANLSNGEMFPSWLTFINRSLTFAGIPPRYLQPAFGELIYPIRVTANDGYQNGILDFDLTLTGISGFGIALAVLGPLVTLGGVGVAAYKNREKIQACVSSMFWRKPEVPSTDEMGEELLSGYEPPVPLTELPVSSKELGI